MCLTGESRLVVFVLGIGGWFPCLVRVDPPEHLEVLNWLVEQP